MVFPRLPSRATASAVPVQNSAFSKHRMGHLVWVPVYGELLQRDGNRQSPLNVIYIPMVNEPGPAKRFGNDYPLLRRGGYGHSGWSSGGIVARGC